MIVTVIGYNPTSKLLAKKMGVERNLTRADVAIIYGLKRKERRLLDSGIYGIVINQRDAVINASDKLKAFSIFKEKGVLCPNYNINKYKVNRPVLGRKINHTQGKDIIYIDSYKKYPKRDFYVEFKPIDKEYRYHVIGGKVIPTLKYNGVTEGKGAYCRNSKTGWKMTTCRPRASVSRIAEQAVRVLGLTFGAVDIIESHGTIYALEVNTAPALIDKRAEQYAHELWRVIHENTTS